MVCKLWIKRIILLLLCLAMVFSAAGCQTNEAESEETTVSEEDTVVVKNAEEAIVQLAESSEAYGFDNALSELTEKSTATIDGDSYFRLQQNYQGIPVYGRTVVCATDEDGNVMSVTGNVLDVNEELDLTPTVTANQIADAIKSYLTEQQNVGDVSNVEVAKLDENDLCIYNMGESGEAYLAYQINADGYEIVVTADTATVLSAKTIVQDASETVTGYAASDVDHIYGVSVEKLGEANYVLNDISKGLTVYTYDGNSSDDSLISGITLISSPDEIFGNTESEIALEQEKGVQLLFNVSRIYDYFDALGFVAAGSGTRLYYNDMFGAGKNARGGYGTLEEGGDEYGVLTLGTVTGVNDIDVIAHEYTHRVSFQVIGWSGNTVENGAINEGISDIFGELIEAWFEDHPSEPDWVMQGDNINVHRNLADPEENGYLANASDEYEGSSTQKYGYCTVISHSAYLMWNGIDGNDSKKINTNDLAKLWYRAMLMMPSDCDFNDCRKLVELAAASMELTTDQIQCVSEAFDAVGITGMAQDASPAFYNLAFQSTLSVYGGNGELYDNYTLHITGNKEIYGPVLEADDSIYESTKIISTSEPYSLKLPQGAYTFAITDNANPKDTYTFLVYVWNDDGDSNLDFFTNFGCTPVKGTVSEIREVDGVETNIPISNATVTIYSHDQETVCETIHMADTDGFFEVYLPIGSYSVIAEAEGYITHTSSFELTEDNAEYLSIRLYPEEKSKKLTQINRYYDDGSYGVYSFSYNEEGQLETFTSDYNSGGTNYHYAYTFFYNENGQLTKYQEDGASFPDYEYYYSSDGVLTGWSLYEMDFLKIEHICEYNEAGQLIRVKAVDGSLDEEYTYDDAGMKVSSTGYSNYGDMSFSTKSTFSYNAEGQLVEENTITDWGSASTTVYSYEYNPFVLKETTHDGEEWYTELILPNVGNGQLVSLSCSGTVSFESKDGYLAKVTGSGDSGYTYEFFYDGDMGESADDHNSDDMGSAGSVFLGTLQEFLDQRAYQAYWEEVISPYIPDVQPTKYALLDIDQDGNNELMVCGTGFTGFTNFLLFEYAPERNEVSRLVVEWPAEPDVFQCYSIDGYSTEKQALVMSILRYSQASAGFNFFVKDGSKLISSMSAGWDTDENGEYFTINGKRCTEEEMQAYRSEGLIRINFLPLA